MRPSSTIIALSSLLTASWASPVKRASPTPYFAVRGFSFSRTDTAARYQANVSFPQDVYVSNTPADQGVYVVPGFTDPVPCTGTYFFSGDEDGESTHITPINACGSPSDPQKSVMTKLDVVTGELFLTYTLNSTSTSSTTLYTYTGSQKGLSPVAPEKEEGFNTPATTGPGIDR